MKLFLIALIATLPVNANSQDKLIPAKSAFEKKWIRNEELQMTWYLFRDTVKIEIGKITTRTTIRESNLIVISTVSIPNMQSPWIDSTIASMDELRPIYHSSYNANRDMTLAFGKVVKGHYIDKRKNTNLSFTDTTVQDYFDSNLYPNLIRWLPLQEGYQQAIAIYDYNPDAKSGVMSANVTEVKKAVFKSPSSGSHDVWIVKVSDEIGNGENGVNTYYIDRNDRRLWKQEIEAGGRRMLIE